MRVEERWAVHGLIEQGGFDRRRVDQRHPHLRPVLGDQQSRVEIVRRLGGAVSTEALHWHEPGCGAIEDDLALVARHHRRDHGLADVDHADVVDFHDSADLLRRMIEQQPPGHDCRTVDQAVDGAMGFDHGRDGLLHLRKVGDIAGVGVDAGRLAGGLAQPGFIHVKNGNRVALVCQPQGVDPAQPAGAARDQCRLHRALLPCSHALSREPTQAQPRFQTRSCEGAAWSCASAVDAK